MESRQGSNRDSPNQGCGPELRHSELAFSSSFKESFYLSFYRTDGRENVMLKEDRNSLFTANILSEF